MISNLLKWCQNPLQVLILCSLPHVLCPTCNERLVFDSDYPSVCWKIDGAWRACVSGSVNRIFRNTTAIFQVCKAHLRFRQQLSVHPPCLQKSTCTDTRHEMLQCSWPPWAQNQLPRSPEKTNHVSIKVDHRSTSNCRSTSDCNDNKRTQIQIM